MRSVYEPSNAIQAHVLQDVLRQHGIASHVQGEHLQGAVGELPAGSLVRLLVAEGDYAAARRAVEEWERAAPMDEEELARMDRSANIATAVATPIQMPGSRRGSIATLLIVVAIGLLVWALAG